MGGTMSGRRRRTSTETMRTRSQSESEPSGPEDRLSLETPVVPRDIRGAHVSTDSPLASHHRTEGEGATTPHRDLDVTGSSADSEDGSDDDEDDDEYIMEHIEEDDEEEEDVDDEEDSDAPHPVHQLMQLIGVSGSRQAQQYPRMPKNYVPPPLDHPLAGELSARSSAHHPRRPVRMAHPCGRPFKWSPTTHITNPAHQLLTREGGLDGRGGSMGAAQRAHFAGMHRLPSQPSCLADRMRSRGYIGQFTADGDLFVAAYQNERRVKIYDVHRGWRVLKNVHARGLRWTVTDTCLSADQKFLLYASISATVHLVNVQRGQGEAESIANVTEIHEPLHFAGDGEGGSYSTGIWSLRWATDNTEIVAGTGDSSIYVYDVTAAKTTVRVEGHQDDVNAVAYADSACQVVFSGSDDSLVKVWDRRCMGGRRSRPAGVLVGHTEGVTHLDAKGDGRYLISNSKDQSVKLWDLRGMRQHQEMARIRRDPVPHFSWDYRWMEYPGRNRLVRHPHDCSLMTYRGHSVLSTLIRAYWSPAATTGQRFVYTGSADGSVWIYDVLTGRVVSTLDYHQEVVRDCSWHPHLPLLASVSFDGSLCCWEPASPGEREEVAEGEQGWERRSDGVCGRGASFRGLPLPGRDQLDDDW